jgi:membrane protein DedA with SNARE-associated domain
LNAKRATRTQSLKNEVERVIKPRFHWQRPVLLILFALAALAVVIFGLRTYRSFVLLHSAYALGAPDVSSVRPWMTLDYLARTYSVPQAALAERLARPPDVDPKTSLRSLARKQNLPPFEHLQQVQEAISELRSITSSFGASGGSSEPEGFGDEILAALLAYGYPVLGLTLMLGAIGVPFPSALSVVVAGSLAAQGQMSWFWAGVVVVACSVLGDFAGYGLGRVLGREFFERRGRWLGLTPAVRAKVEIFFQKWGALTVVLSRSLLSFKSSAVNLLAGASRYRLRLFLPFAIVGRLIWSSAYLTLGYLFGVAIEAAADFTSSLSGLLLALVILAALGLMIQRNHARLRAAQS